MQHTWRRQMRRASRGFKPVVVVALEVVGSLTPFFMFSSVERMHVPVLKESIIVQRPTSRFGAFYCFWSEEKGKGPPVHWSVCPRSGQGAPPCFGSLSTSRFLVLVLLLHLPQAPQLPTLQSTGIHVSAKSNLSRR